MSRHEVGGQKWAAGKAGEWRGEEGVGVMYEGAASRARAQCHGRGRSVMDEGMASQMRAWNHPRGRSEGGVSSMDEGAVREMSAAQMRRAARTAGCMATHALPEWMYQVDMAGTMVVVGLEQMEPGGGTSTGPGNFWRGRDMSGDVRGSSTAR